MKCLNCKIKKPKEENHFCEECDYELDTSEKQDIITSYIKEITHVIKLYNDQFKRPTPDLQ